MKLAKSEVGERIIIKVNRNIKQDGVNGLMLFGDNNDYPQLIENIILSSVTAKAVVGIYAKFLAGKGFTEEMNKQVVGYNQFGAEITLFDLLYDVCLDLAKFHGAYIHTNLNLDFEVGNTKRLPFKYGRIAKTDDNGYAAKIIDTTNISVGITAESEYHVLILRIISVYINQSGRNSWQ